MMRYNIAGKSVNHEMPDPLPVRDSFSGDVENGFRRLTSINYCLGAINFEIISIRIMMHGVIRKTFAYLQGVYLRCFASQQH